MFDSDSRHLRHRLTHARWVLPALVAVLFVLLQGFAGPRTAMNGDSEQYGRISLQVSGVPAARASRESWSAWCDSQAQAAARTAGLDPLDFRRPSPAPGLRTACLHRYRAHTTAAGRRYQAIFDGRIGYPLLAVPGVRLLGVRIGLWATSLLLTGAGGFLVAALLGAAGVGLLGAVAGELIFLLGPLGQWGLHPLAEGALNTAVLLCLLGGWWLLSAGDQPADGAGLPRSAGAPASAGRWRGAARPALVRGGLVWAAGLAAVGLVKYSSATLLGVCLAVVAVMCWITVRAARHAGTVLLGAGSLLLAVLADVLSSALGAPGAEQTLQDTFTRHFHRGDVPDPWGLLVRLDVRFWGDWLHAQAAAPALLLLTAVACALLFRYRPLLGWLAVAGALLGMLTIAAHPLIYEFERLGALEWLPSVLGLPLLLPGVLPERRTGAVERPRQEALNRSA